jgi:hypothetical protein
MTDEQRAEFKRLSEAATPGAWRHWGEFDTQHVVKAPSQMICNTLHGNDEANARFIAAAHPAAVLDLLAENERLKAEIQRMKEDATDASLAAWEREEAKDRHSW